MHTILILPFIIALKNAIIKGRISCLLAYFSTYYFHVPIIHGSSPLLPPPRFLKISRARPDMLTQIFSTWGESEYSGRCLKFPLRLVFLPARSFFLPLLVQLLLLLLLLLLLSRFGSLTMYIRGGIIFPFFCGKEGRGGRGTGSGTSLAGIENQQPLEERSLPSPNNTK